MHDCAHAALVVVVFHEPQVLKNVISFIMCFTNITIGTNVPFNI